MTDNMYDWVTKRRNYLGGECSHSCKYCYVQNMKKQYPSINERYSGPPHLLENELKKNEGKGHTIFVCTCNDLFAEAIPKVWIEKVLAHCRKNPENTYLFQTKNPKRLQEFPMVFPSNSIFGTTIETNSYIIDDIRYDVSAAPIPGERACWLSILPRQIRTMVSIEPIIDFDLDKFVRMIRKVGPEFVSIGADSKNHHLPEPSAEKTLALIAELKKFTTVKLKMNLVRIIGKENTERLMKK